LHLLSLAAALLPAAAAALRRRHLEVTVFLACKGVGGWEGGGHTLSTP